MKTLLLSICHKTNKQTKNRIKKERNGGGVEIHVNSPFNIINKHFYNCIPDSIFFN